MIVARAASGTLPHFPDLVALADGRLLCAYRESTGHVRADGRIMLVESADRGQTWSEPRAVADGPNDDRDPKLVQLRDGTVLLSYFVLDWHPDGKFTCLGTSVIRSEDGGRTWSDPVVAGGDDLLWAVSHGAAAELPDGDLLLPLYGVDPRQGAGLDSALAVRSTDGGRTWAAETAVPLGISADFHFREPTLTVLPSGEVVALLRTSVEHAYLARSTDGGHTWTPPVETDLPASSHHVLLLADGSLLVAYGDISKRFSPRRSTVARIVTDPAGEWTGPDLHLYDSGHPDQANPSSVELEPGRFLTVSFDVPAATVVAFTSERAAYVTP
ncbi:MAG: exo-alpha-sialidase [Hamadaea sp.]|nr:exo-alpha-sialidase [Hamadaea sp.]NUT06689.1 exo-alpha-sialidase [Hamadaea sp.]